ncbi:MAG: DNA repair protein RadA, partial [Gemmatimonadota bacterium]
LAVLLAVLERRAQLRFSDQDVFVNVTGGLRLIEPATDMAVVAALTSSLLDKPVSGKTVFLGEVGLGGEIRPVSSTERRLAEAKRLGFERAFVSASSTMKSEISTVAIAHVSDLAHQFAA